MAEKKSAPVAKKAVAAKKAPVKKAPVKAPEKKKIEMNQKMADPDSILNAYDNLIDQLAKVEASQRLKSKPFRIYFVHRKRMEVMKLNFIKSMR